MVTYGNKSPWYNTKVGSELGLFSIRPVSIEAGDILYTIEPQYNNRPDLLAYDIYGSDKLWWVFTQRNMDTIQDPIFDFRTGVKIYLPSKESLFKVLGI